MSVSNLFRDTRFERAYLYAKKDVEVGFKRLDDIDERLIQEGGLEGAFTKYVRRPIVYPFVKPIVVAAIYIRDLIKDEPANR
ncbi:hypothetical protein HYV81_04940 [Candidatus Woesearchaeota archaeon]|nr:hypothetical protein [Candidatus Woesearchaeota archaeon]